MNMTLDLFPPPHNRVGGMEWAPRWAYWRQMLLYSTYYVQDWTGGRLTRLSTWPKQLVPQEIAGKSDSRHQLWDPLP